MEGASGGDPAGPRKAELPGARKRFPPPARPPHTRLPPVPWPDPSRIPPRPRRGLHPGERLTLLAAGAHLVLLPWALGGMYLWGQMAGAMLGLLALAAAVRPRVYPADEYGEPDVVVRPAAALVRFPVFWLGAALLGVMAAGALNPAWAYRTDGLSWWMEARPAAAGWPAGVEVPLARGGPWRMLLSWAGAWLTFCALVVGLHTRRAGAWALGLVAANGLAVGLVGIGQRLAGTPRILGFFDSPNDQFFGSFVYKNHGAAFLLLALVAALALAVHFHVQAARRLEKSHPGLVWLFLVLCLGLAIVASASKGVTLVLLGFLGVAGPVAAGFILRHRHGGARGWIALGAFALVLGGFLLVGLRAVQSDRALERIWRSVSRADRSLAEREEARTAALELLAETWPRGGGAGSFQFLFPRIQQHHPRLLHFPDGRRMFWEHAHNDLVQFPLELGLAGSLLAAAALAYGAAALLRARAWASPVPVLLGLGLLALAGHAAWDFPLQCPAVLVTAAALAALLLLWARTAPGRPNAGAGS